MHPHEIEEREMRFGPRMWDATPGVCCAYFQTGACSHTEAMDWEYELASMPDECDHVGTERVKRTCHGYLGDTPKGAVETLCDDCGALLDVTPAPKYMDEPF